jgi:hypothetical protein
MRASLALSVFAAIALTQPACDPPRSAFARHPSAAIAFDRAAADPKALAIADQVLAAAGGAERWNQVKQLTWSEQVTSGGKVVLSYEQAWDRWNGRHGYRQHNAANKTYMVGVSANPTQSKRAAEGDIVVMRKLYEAGGGAFMTSGSTFTPLLDVESRRALASARERWSADVAILCMPFLLEAPGTRLSYEGDAPGDAGQTLDELRVTLDPRDPAWTSTYHVLVNRETHRIERIEIVEAGQSDLVRSPFRLTGWVESAGLAFATMYDNIGVPGNSIKIEDVTVGPVDDALYVPTVN